MEIFAQNTEDFHTISKSVQKAWNFLRDSKASSFEWVFPGSLSNDDDDFFLGHQQLGTSLYGVHTGDLSKGPLEAQSNSHRKFALQGGCRQLEGRRKDDECDLRMLRNSCVIPQGDAVRSHHI